jgi:outer membrane protein
MKKVLALTAAVVAAFGSTSVFAETEGNWMMRVRAVDVRPEKKSDSFTVPAVGPNATGPLTIASDAVYLDNKTIPEVDFTYFFSKNLAAELILTYPQKMDVHVSPVGTQGTLKVLPPTLTLQYHFLPDGTFRPYVGAGVNYTRISNINLSPLDTTTTALADLPNSNTVDKNSWGGALQIGFDVKVGTNSYINFDYKKLYIKTDLKNSVLGKISTLKVDPQLFAIGYGFKF